LQLIYFVYKQTLYDFLAYACECIPINTQKTFCFTEHDKTVLAQPEQNRIEKNGFALSASELTQESINRLLSKSFRKESGKDTYLQTTRNGRQLYASSGEKLDKQGWCQYFTSLDLSKGFHQIQMDPESNAKSVVSSKHNHYEYTRMPFGLKNVPTTFQRCTNNLFEELIYKDCLVYLDAIIIFSTSLEKHILTLKKVFEKL